MPAFSDKLASPLDVAILLANRGLCPSYRGVNFYNNNFTVAISTVE